MLATYVSGSKLAILSMPSDNNETATPAKKDYIVTKDDPTGISNLTVDANKKVVSVKYVNVAGMESSTPFQGVNIMVTKYDDGTQTSTKIIK